MLEFKAARINDINQLNAIAFKSEGLWDHSEEMIASFRREYSLKKVYLKDNKVINMLLEDTIIGFYAFNMSQQIPELEYFYLKPKFIGQGYGRKLWNNAIKFCENNKIKEFIFVAGPEVKDYYLKMGAEVIEILPSKLDSQREIFKLKMLINREDLTE